MTRRSGCPRVLRARPPRPAGAAPAVLAALAVLATVGSSLPAPAAAASRLSVSRVAPASRPRPVVPHGGVSAPSRYLRQVLAWEPCFDRETLALLELPSSYARLECATYRAPRDWANPESGVDVTIAISRLRATAPGGVRRRTVQTLFTNPGGPGGEGRTLPLVFLDAKRKSLLAARDVYGIDPRGTGASTNLTCGNYGGPELDYRDRQQENLDLLVDSARVQAQACRLKGGALLPFVTTEQTVQDLDLLRQLTGTRRMNWIGYSGGTWIGAYYATYFPQQAGRLVLDSNTEFTATWQQVFARQPAGFQRRFEADFAPWAAAHDDMFGLGTTGPAVVAAYEALRADVAAAAAAGAAPFEVDGPALDSLIASGLYSKSSFSLVGLVLSLLRAELDDPSAGAGAPPASGSPARPLALRRLERLSRAGVGVPGTPVSMDAEDATFYAITCNDTAWTGDASTLVTDSAAAGASYPLIGWSTISQPCVFWQRPALAMPVPDGVGAPPVLMVQSTHDPATPLEGAQAAAAGFAGARLLTVTGEGDHGLYAGGNTCVDAAVEKFLLTGTLPAPGATCAGLPVPEPQLGTAPGASGSAAAVARVFGVRGPAGRTNPLLAGRALAELLPAR